MGFYHMPNNNLEIDDLYQIRDRLAGEIKELKYECCCAIGGMPPSYFTRKKIEIAGLQVQLDEVQAVITAEEAAANALDQTDTSG